MRLYMKTPRVTLKPYEHLGIEGSKRLECGVSGEVAALGRTWAVHGDAAVEISGGRS